jgi:integrase
MRELIAAPGVKTVFVNDAGDSYTTSEITGKIKTIFIRWTGVPITPHDLRHLYRTYIDDPATGATAEEKESAAYWMRHSSQMAAKTYSHLNNEQKLRAGSQMAERLNQEFLESQEVSYFLNQGRSCMAP